MTISNEHVTKPHFAEESRSKRDHLIHYYLLYARRRSRDLEIYPVYVHLSYNSQKEGNLCHAFVLDAKTETHHD